MMELRPVGVGGVLAVLGNAIRSETGAPGCRAQGSG